MPIEEITQTFREPDFDLVTNNSNLSFDEASELDKGMVGVAYDNDIAVSGGMEPFTSVVTVGTLPDGLSLDGVTISGTPTQIEEQTFTVSIEDANGWTCMKALTLEIMPAITITTE
jgi:hypothetical protein